MPLVEAQLARLNTAFVRFDTDNSSIEFEAIGDGSTVSLFEKKERIHRGEKFAAVLFRHIKPPSLPAGVDPETGRFISAEYLAEFEGAILSLEPELWINHPLCNNKTRNKLQQLKAAAALGFPIPDTLVSNNPTRIRRFFETCDGQVIAKLVGGQQVADTVEEQFVIHTTKLTEEDLANPSALAAAPAIYQKLIEKSADIRVTVVGETVFACRIASQSNSESSVDWRAAGHRTLEHEIVELPSQVNKLCRAMLRRFELHMAGIDLVECPDGNYVFLEINAMGQWRWIEEHTGAPIAAEIADHLRRAVLSRCNLT